MFYFLVFLIKKSIEWKLKLALCTMLWLHTDYADQLAQDELSMAVQ